MKEKEKEDLHGILRFEQHMMHRIRNGINLGSFHCSRKEKEGKRENKFSLLLFDLNL
jgi:hypothetical protein